MKKQSNMGSSKYEFNPEQFDIDVARNHERYQQKKLEIKIKLWSMLFHEPDRVDETFNIICDVLREFKEEQDAN
ncbi:hypothetical protein SAMN05444392_102319 [Seinonella peptonophila]|uniref:Uncharacterized protein n=1 Tax=Seinonella peptonophila TaxID=112248 RepID=A0A1M4VEC1_9BACL|nr:hypothetical protein [Seinonella peptonophila]SHE67277.1 hypothetical protein SAMN05444392_102319 [Seinonella peptonophila]